MKKIRVLIVDDSPLMRAWLKHILSDDPEIGEIYSAQSPFEARGLIRTHRPDVITLDVEMPGMDGISFLREIMETDPLPVIMVSAYTRENSENTIRALALGAVDCIAKPGPGMTEEKESFPRRLLSKVKTAALARIFKPALASPSLDPRTGRKGLPPYSFGRADRIIAIGASTGGTQALDFILSRLPAGLPPLVIVQHMPAPFTAAFAEYLDQNSPLTVREARSGDLLEPGLALVVPGDFHGRIRKGPFGPEMILGDDPPVNHHRPSVDVLFYSLAETLQDKTIGLLLTGMGEDGARGLLALRRQGARTLVQDQATSIVFGMPKAAIRLGAAETVAPLEDLPENILRLLR